MVRYGSSGGQAAYSSYGTLQAHSTFMGDTSAYESSVIQSPYESDSPMGDTTIDGGTIIDSPPMDGSLLENDSPGTETIVDPIRYESAKPAIDADAAMLNVAVPDNAVVTVNGHPTSSDGRVRQFMSRGLKEGFVYTYIVDVTYDVDGAEKKESKSIQLRPGDVETVEFESASKDNKSGDDLANSNLANSENEVTGDDVITVVKLNVPTDAKVSLAGNDTAGEGSVRTFRTNQLKAGQQWTDYTVLVTTDIDGRPISKQRTVNVQAGSTIELTFEFDTNTVASR
jgi:uncharacterized protein (TIGR03000 family)